MSQIGTLASKASMRVGLDVGLQLPDKAAEAPLPPACSFGLWLDFVRLVTGQSHWLL